jgi:hypothetical protein
MRTSIVVAAGLLLLAVPVLAQDAGTPIRPAPGEPVTPAAEEAPLPAPAPLPEEELQEDEQAPGSYDPQGRRDPFRPLTGEAADTELRAKYEHMLRGRLLQEVRLTSIVKTPRGSIATFEGGPNREGYFARVGDQLWDGTVIDIDFDKMTVTVRQKLDDPRLIKDYRDVPVPLFSDEEMQAQGRSTGAPPQQ